MLNKLYFLFVEDFLFKIYKHTVYTVTVILNFEKIKGPGQEVEILNIF